MEMTSRERVMAAFQHEEPDRVPAWCGSSIEFWEKAKQATGLDDEGLLCGRQPASFRCRCLSHRYFLYWKRFRKPAGPFNERESLPAFHASPPQATGALGP